MGGSAGTARGKKNALPKPFPAITPQSYLPGAAAAAGGGLYPGNVPPVGANQYPAITPNSYLPPPNTIPPPNLNFNTGYNPLPPASNNPMAPPMRGPPPISYRNPMPMMRRPAPFYNPRYRRRRPVRISHRHRSHRYCPVVRIIEADSCSSISTCSTISSCSPCRHRSCSYSRDYRTSQQQQQPIILLPIQCQQQLPAITAPIQRQAQPIILPPIQVQQQSLALPPISSTPVIIQPLNSTSQIIRPGKPQQIQAGPIRYVQAVPKSASSSQLKFVSVAPPSSTAPQRVLVNSTNKNQSTILKPIL